MRIIKNKQISVKNIKAFSLVEISMVLIIIALILASIMAGNSMIEAFRIKKTYDIIREHQASTVAFKTEFNSLPGDFNRAATFWSGAVNGDNNNFIGGWEMTGSENVQAFYQLMKANFITGSYNPSFGATAKPGYNVGASSIKQSAFFYFYSGDLWGEYPYGTSIRLANINEWLDGGSVVPVLHAYNLDTKYDDGKPGTGSIISMNGDGDNCVDSNPSDEGGSFVPEDAAFILTDRSETCTMHFGVLDYVF